MELSFKEFLNELKKQKVKLTASQQMELLSLFNEQTNMIQDMTIKINSIHEKLDEKVFEIYNILTKEIDIIKDEITIKL